MRCDVTVDTHWPLSSTGQVEKDTGRNGQMNSKRIKVWQSQPLGLDLIRQVVDHCLHTPLSNALDERIDMQAVHQPWK
ncbi:MAG: hypothetical protein Ct9H300mP25_13470 [Acidobacteriota bacterium]|nr:MAG: hypothetical protein Ct9H300mP25_13470 [Acidobacteriota bacterium]